ncbi:MAG: hypothetical protein CSA49_04855 [Gammaproteobacteria bacterium]|nr:MAG: hypothetical protein CSA49_04855 [Gammaproteobacteria bacterium]
MDLYEQQDLREFLVSLYGPQARRWPMTDRMFNLTYELVSESSACSDAMDYVTRPLQPGMDPIKWITKQAREMFLRALKERKEHYVICLKAAAYTMKFRFDEASMGI